MGRKLKHPVSSQELSSALDLEFLGPPSIIDRIATRDDGGLGTLGFVKSDLFIPFIQPGCAIIALRGPVVSKAKEIGAVFISDSPRLDFIRALLFLEDAIGFVWSQDPAFIHPTAILGRNVVIGNGARIGANTQILHNVVIGDEVLIGEGCVIKSSSVIGESGFGFERNIDGKAVRFPHIGGVRIGRAVEVGSLTTVCRGAIEDTVLHDGVKIDDHVHIAHNCTVGEDTFLTACVELSGGVTVGRQVWIAPNVTVNSHVTIGDRATVGLGAVVRKDVLDDQFMLGNPARPSGSQ